MRQSIILAAHEVRRLQAGAGSSVLAVRPVEPQPEYKPEHGYEWYMRRKDQVWEQYTTEQLITKRCPYPLGARLAVRETWFDNYANRFSKDDHTLRDHDGNPYILYRADGEYGDMDGESVENCGGWRSPSTMPLWASRATVEVVRVECRRVQEITSEKVLAAGMGSTRMSSLANNCVLWSWETYPTPNVYTSAELAFKGWWEQRHGARYPWAESWAWFLTVERRTAND